MVSLGLVALDSTVLATGAPSIVESLGGFASFPWLLSAHLPAQAVSASVYSKLTDTLGRKPVMPAGIGTFMSGSILAGLAWRMPVLINCRTIQRFGAGAIQPAIQPARQPASPPAQRSPETSTQSRNGPRSRANSQGLGDRRRFPPHARLPRERPPP